VKDDDEEITSVRHMPATVLRVTPLRDGGSPDHSRAMTYHLAEPLLFGVGAVQYVPAFTRSPTADLCMPAAPPRMIGALVAEFEHPQRRDIQAIAQGIRLRRRIGAAIEAWAGFEPGKWWYAVVPWWRRQQDTDVWPLDELPDHRAYAVGGFLAVNAYAWPSPSPLPDRHELSPGTQLVYGVTTVPPPPPGLAPITGTGA
jgi:hypothetical protein